MRRVRLAVAGIAVAAMTLGVAAPAGAQEEPEALGFAVNATEGPPGALVLGQVDTADVAEHCTTDLEEFQARFAELLALMEGPLLDRFLEPDQPPGPQNHDQLAFVLTGVVVEVISANLLGTAEDALPDTFVMTFADIASQDPVGEMGNFDPDTGEGSVVVPDLEPGLWAVAAACVGPSLDLDFLEAGIRASGDFLREIGAPIDLGSPEFQEFVREFLDDENANIFTFLTEIGPRLVETIVTPDAFGAVVFCVHNAEGVCPEPPPPGPPGEPIEPRPPSEQPVPAQPVVAAPTFTG